MFGTDYVAEFKGHQIAARSSWTLGVSLAAMKIENKLYVDGHVVDTNSDWLVLSKAPIMRGSIQEGDKTHIVEVFGRTGMWRLKLRIHIDGQKVVGDDF